MPRINRHFEMSPIPNVHVDVRVLFNKLKKALPEELVQFTGGLKDLEKKWNIIRPPSLQSVDGALAVHLWQLYTKNPANRHMLETLQAYNTADLFSMAHLLPLAFNKVLSTLPFAVPEMPALAVPANPFPVSPVAIRTAEYRAQFHHPRLPAKSPQ